TMFLLTIGADGNTTDCRIVGSSGFPSLDARTCELLLARATFRPAKDKAGQAVRSFYINRIRWQLPR
ncbi:energy transducer TonB, partial [Sphingopyxis sp.]|uniref:energy transducer TonB n=1 Tax=Sphingopyxis sp. TaxID=1908224 RepID=UPI002ED9FD32